MRRFWQLVLRKYSAATPRQRVTSILVAVLALCAIGSMIWAGVATQAPEEISMTKLVSDSHAGLIKSASLHANSIDIIYVDKREARFRGVLPDDTLIELVGAGV